MVPAFLMSGSAFSVLAATVAGALSVFVTGDKRTLLLVSVVGILLAAALGVLSYFLARSRSRLAVLKEKLERQYELRRTFSDADENCTFLKDENRRYVFVNRSFAALFGKSASAFTGYGDEVFENKEFAEESEKMDCVVLENAATITGNAEMHGHVYKITKFPVKLDRGRTGIGGYISDITEEREAERKQQKAAQRAGILQQVFMRRYINRREYLDFVLHKALELTQSVYGYIFLYDAKTQELTLNSWTLGVLDSCTVKDQVNKYALANTGIWGEVIRQGKPIVVNDFLAPNPLKKGYPEGHVQLKRYMSVPVTVEGEIVAVVGFGNKDEEYGEDDVYELQLLMNGVWNVLKRKEIEENTATERNKYLQSLVSIGDGVMVVNAAGTVDMLNRAAEALTGFSDEEARGKPYKEVFRISAVGGNAVDTDPIETVLATHERQELGENTVLTSLNGRIYNIEDSAAPILDENNLVTGVVVVFRDVTEKKEQRERIEYLSFHDALTGLYNRRFFEEELRRLDTPRNLPLSVVLCDVNALKLTNDIFGHVSGDILLKKAGEVLKRVCRADDIIARWGGDEFVLLLPNTDAEKAQQVVKRIRTEFAKEKVRAIRCSMSMGTATKSNDTDNVLSVLDTAEETMYFAKALERDGVMQHALEAIIGELNAGDSREEAHSRTVRALCEAFGKRAGMNTDELKRLGEAAALHDIGKIVLPKRLLNRIYRLTDEERNEVKKHPIIGYRILNSFDTTMNFAETVLCHHERWDGTGFPKRLLGEQIPLHARIIAVAESYDRMCYDTEGSPEEKKQKALENIRRGSGHHFDPDIAREFIDMIESADAF